MANFVGRPMSRSNGQTDSSGLSHVERDSISNYIIHSRDNGQGGQGHKVTLDSEVQSLMRAGIHESTARQLIGNLKGERDNPGVSTLALALPNPGGVGVRPPNLDEIRRNGMEDKMAKRKLSQRQLAALAKGQAVLQEMRDNITASRARKALEEGKGFALDSTIRVRKKDGVETPLSWLDITKEKHSKVDAYRTKKGLPAAAETTMRDVATLPRRRRADGSGIEAPRLEIVPVLDKDGNTIALVGKAPDGKLMGAYDPTTNKMINYDPYKAPAGTKIGDVLKSPRATRRGKEVAILGGDKSKYIVLRKEKLVVDEIKPDGVRTQKKQAKKDADNKIILDKLNDLNDKVKTLTTDYTKIDIAGLAPEVAAIVAARAQLQRNMKAETKKKKDEEVKRLRAKIAELEAAQTAAVGVEIPYIFTAEGVAAREKAAKDAEKTRAKNKAERIAAGRFTKREIRDQLINTYLMLAESGEKPSDITKQLNRSPGTDLDNQIKFLRAEIEAVKQSRPTSLGGARSAAARDNATWTLNPDDYRDNGYHMDRHNTSRDNITLKSGLYGVASFVGGTAAGVVVTNGVHKGLAYFGVAPKHADYVTKGVGALLAVDLFLSMRDNRGYIFHRIEDRGVRIGLAAGLILPMIARSFVGSMLDKYEFGKKINTFLLPGSSNSFAGVGAADAKKAAEAAAVAPASGFGSIYDLAFDEVELPTSGVGVDVNEAVAGMGRYVTGAQGVGRYVTGAEGMGRYVTGPASGTSGLGVNVSEAFAGVGVNATEALAGQQPSFRTGGTVFRDGLRGLGADEAFDILSELENFDDLSDDDQYMEGIGAVSRNEKAVYASANVAQRLKSALATAGREVALTFLRPSNVRPNTYIVIVSRPGAESAKQALSQMTQVPSSQPIPPTTLPNAIMTRGVFGKPLFPVTT